MTGYCSISVVVDVIEGCFVLFVGEAAFVRLDELGELLEVESFRAIGIHLREHPSKPASARKLPLDELKRNIVLAYGNPETKEQEVDNQTPPPRRVGIVETVPPGEQREFQVVFAYPAKIAPLTNDVVNLRFCIRWESTWLRAASYTADAFDWNPAFQLCRNVQIVRD